MSHPVMSDLKLISTKEVSKHCTLGHCWLVVENNVWDFSEFAGIHPGGDAGESLFSTLRSEEHRNHTVASHGLSSCF